MGIDYKKEVDSGIDRKVAVEKIITELLKEGVPPEIIMEGSNFNPRHIEMLNNLAKGYDYKFDEFSNMNLEYGVNNDLSSNYTDVTHNIKELYPMTSEEEKEIFIRRDKLKKQIEKNDSKKIKNIEKEINKIIDGIANLKSKYPNLNKLIEMVNEIEDSIKDNKSLKSNEIDEILHKYNFSKHSLSSFEIIYKKYQELNSKLDSLYEEKINIENNKMSSKESYNLELELNKINEEIISRNIKLVNYFIRSKYSKLLVDQEELFDICLLGLTEALNKFEVAKNYKFSSYAFKSMDIAVKKNFKNLTGFNWDAYWGHKKIKLLLEIASTELEKSATVEDLIELGFINYSYTTALAYSKLPFELVESYLYDEGDVDKMDTTFEDYEKIDKLEEEKYKYEVYELEEFDHDIDLAFLKENLKGALDTLTTRERICICLRFGLNDYLTDEEKDYFKPEGRCMTLEEVANKFNITRERVRQIEAKTMRKLRHPSRSNQLR